jgi:hypothetical protein
MTDEDPIAAAARNLRARQLVGRPVLTRAPARAVVLSRDGGARYIVTNSQGTVRRDGPKLTPKQRRRLEKGNA